MEKKFILIMMDGDGSQYSFGSDLKKMKEKFQEAKDKELFDLIVLAEVEEGTEFGFGSYGDFFGGDVIEEYS